ncbi:MAG: hypothetical protein KA015_00660 [Spirochaetes bacterium]|nr:hypothetical protein [Spirochaetota bacterium]
MERNNAFQRISSGLEILSIHRFGQTRRIYSKLEAAGHFYQKRLNNQAVDAAEKEGRTATDAEGNPLTKDPLGKVENFLAGMYESICGGMARIRQGVSGVIDSVADGLSTFGEKLGNLLTGEGFNTDKEVARNTLFEINAKMGEKSIFSWDPADVGKLSEKEKDTLRDLVKGKQNAECLMILNMLGENLSDNERKDMKDGIEKYQYGQQEYTVSDGVYYGNTPEAVLVGGNEKFQKHYDRLQDAKSNYMLEKQLGEQARQAKKNLDAYADQNAPKYDSVKGQAPAAFLAISDNLDFANEVYFMPRNINIAQDQLVTAEIIKSISNYLDGNDDIGDDFKEQIMNSVLSKKYYDAQIISPDYYKDNPWEVDYEDAYMMNRGMSEIIGKEGNKTVLYGSVIVTEQREERYKHLQNTIESFVKGDKALTNYYNSKKGSSFWIIPNDNLSKIKEAQLKELKNLRTRYVFKKAKVW